MPYKMEVRGEEELLSKMEKVPEKARKIAAQALYEGAGIVADAVSRGVQGIPTEPFKYATGGKKRKPSPEEKAIVAQAQHGIAKFKKTPDDVNTSIGFQNSGYGAISWNHARTNTRTKYKIGDDGIAKHASMGSGVSSKPVPLIVNSINSGTSFMEKHPFLRKAFSQSKTAAVAAIEAGLKSREAELDAGD